MNKTGRRKAYTAHGSAARTGPERAWAVYRALYATDRTIRLPFIEIPLGVALQT